ncbi:LuxR C-terminal-related transcriptional regulator [Paraburkholderia sediminicola]|uniref:LuxR C-terminal-related transcriptional regulator n=1 Tax=Paraburkholderia sediminicola TaxID=458836 RepID=UPI0038BBF4DC
MSGFDAIAPHELSLVQAAERRLPSGPVGDRGEHTEMVYIDEDDIEDGVHEELGNETAIATELGAARTAKERVAIVRGALRIAGFSSFGYAAFAQGADGLPSRVYLLRNYFSNALLPGSLSCAHLRGDWRIRRALHTGQPHIWDIDSLIETSCGNDSAHAMRRHFEHMRNRGVCSGVSFGLPIHRTPLRAMFVCASPLETCDWITENVLAQAISLGLSLHQRCSAYVRAVHRDTVAGNLSDMQQRLLDLVVDGLTDKEIAQRLNTTTHNVDYHLRQLRDRCGAKNRSQLAYIAGLMQVV